MVICLYRAQAQLFAKANPRTFQLDMNYKHLEEKTENEINLAWKDQALGRCK
jgi:hypothetical protein